ncbi:tetratricopeptide repeat protein 19 homolog, mitochondrial isoform X3 [Drosophila yakuba]|uniref:tetratricopeptide repeat protein 19 homolog, mitochondrial isoform X3 n=1 Tax=Drosophila yakuba TaxID=7245 RepID=UPI0019307639|nr:tetratricopeptide repeat protein 19 homolog, mitochondrial isoform X3 [Drosophila yakuba]
MLVKNICKFTQVMSRFRLAGNPRDYCHFAPLKRSRYHQRSEFGSRPLCANAADYQVAWAPPPVSGSSGGMFWAFSAAFTLNLFGGGNEKEETPEDKLIKTIKRSILCIQREQYDKAEQMLHLALRMAQDIQSKDGITYVFDLMANLAMEREQFKKAEKIFTDVMKRLFADGHTEESPKILHISSKIAHMSQLQGDLEKSFQGFTWTLQQLAKLLEKMPDDKDILELYGLTKNWY